MSAKNKSPRFSRLIRELIRNEHTDASEGLAVYLGLKSTKLIEMWQVGRAYPQDVVTVRRLAENRLLHGHEVMTAWLPAFGGDLRGQKSLLMLRSPWRSSMSKWSPIAPLIALLLVSSELKAQPALEVGGVPVGVSPDRLKPYDFGSDRFVIVRAKDGGAFALKVGALEAGANETLKVTAISPDDDALGFWVKGLPYTTSIPSTVLLTFRMDAGRLLAAPYLP